MHNLINIKKIEKNYIYTKDKIIQILEVKPINFYLMSVLEQKALLENFKFILFNINNSIQIQIKIQKLNQEETYKYLYEQRNLDTDIFKEEITESYINFLKDIGEEDQMNSYKFYIVNSIEYTPETINEKSLILEENTKKISEELIKIKNYNNILNKKELTNLIIEYFV